MAESALRFSLAPVSIFAGLGLKVGIEVDIVGVKLCQRACVRAEPSLEAEIRIFDARAERGAERSLSQEVEVNEEGPVHSPFEFSGMGCCELDLLSQRPGLHWRLAESAGKGGPVSRSWDHYISWSR